MQRTDFSQENCLIARTLDLVGKWWSLLVIREALLGVTRCDNFQRRFGISRNALTDRLRKLVGGGDLVTVVAAMLRWGGRWLILPDALLSRMIETATGHPVARLEATSSDRRRLGLAELGLASDLGRADLA